MSVEGGREGERKREVTIIKLRLVAPSYMSHSPKSSLASPVSRKTERKYSTLFFALKWPFISRVP